MGMLVALYEGSGMLSGITGVCVSAAVCRIRGVSDGGC